jgi:AraC-like DNA-binding protein
VCRKPQVKCGECPNQAFISLSDTIIRRHLGGSNGKSSDGDFVAGVYPLLPDRTCRFLAVDFDGDDWSSDASARRLLDNVLVSRARRMLLYADESAARVAASLGFDDPSYFRRFFRGDIAFFNSAFHSALCFSH